MSPAGINYERGAHPMFASIAVATAIVYAGDPAMIIVMNEAGHVGLFNEANFGVGLKAPADCGLEEIAAKGMAVNSRWRGLLPPCRQQPCQVCAHIEPGCASFAKLLLQAGEEFF